jgi:hypothetical protein|tara:strand:+ start:135 stop:401 length:267 start_codon:yes stop_codon:yes gene_type:complete
MGGYVLEVCSGRAAWQVQPSSLSQIEMGEVSEKIISSGWECTLKNRLCYTFSGPVDLTLFPSGKLLIKTPDQQIADDIAKKHIETWLN